MSIFVGREREMATLREALERALQCDGSLVLVSGEAGIGKTSLVRTFTHEAAERGAVILRGYCYDLSTTPPYGPWLGLADRYRADSGLPEIPEVLKRDAGVGDLQSQAALFEVALGFFFSLAKKRPLVLVLEDVHWADQASLDLLRFTARQLRGHRILAIATYRDDEVSQRHPLYQLLPAVIRESQAERVDLRALNVDDVGLLVQQRYVLSDSDHERLVTYLHARAEGNPLFTEEVLRSLEREGLLAFAEVSWQLSNLSNTTVPSLIRQMVDTRVAALSESSRSALQAAAVLGQEVQLAHWERLTESDVVVTAAQEGLDAQLLVESRDIDDIMFRHALIREAIYEGTPLFQRRNLHRQVAEILVAQSGSDPDDVAYHFQQAGDDRAFEWMVKAAERAERGYAWVEAIDRYEAAATLAGQFSEGEAISAGLMLRISRVLRFLDPHRGLEYARECHRSALITGNNVLAAHALLNIGVLLCMTNEIGAGTEAIRNAVRTIEQSVDNADQLSQWSYLSLQDEDLSRPLLRAYATLSIWAAGSGHYAEAIDAGKKCIGDDWYDAASLNRSPDTLLKTDENANAYPATGYALAQLGRPDEARIAIELGYRVSAGMSLQPFALQMAYLDLIAIHLPYRTRHLNERSALAANLRQLSDASSETVSGPGIWATELLLFHEGRWRELHEFEESWNRRDPQPYFHDMHTHVIARLHWHQGSSERARELVAMVLPNGPKTVPGDNIHAFGLRNQRLAAEIAMSGGELALARAWLEAHDRWIDWNSAVLGRAEGLLLWGKLYLAEGDADTAHTFAERALKQASDPEQPLALITIHRFLGELALRTQALNDAEQNLRRSLDLAEACAIPFERALTMLAMAELVASQGDVDETRRMLNEVRRISTNLGARPTLECVEKLAARLQPRRAEPRFGLSSREMDVLRLLVQGKSDREIAEELFISHHTVMRHVSHILAKLDVESRTAAAACAVRNDLL